ncbi:hypothetical protein TIFTF001_026413 [Ficus carica]|uniref:Uncharacterized protein n=1 Tax=Ficus carica TaxID=3494 RepID=A0AA88DL87_FICCA|nr:hypothetical protein TIFTF001_026413 [Ficus carica]
MTTPSPTDQPRITLKLLIDSKEKRVLFTEAGKDFADFLFTHLSLPVGTVIKLLSSNCMDTLLKPNSPFGGSATLLSLTNDASTSKRIFSCSWPSCCYCGDDSPRCSRHHVSDNHQATCPSCHRQISVELPYVAQPAAPADLGGIVKGVVMYMVMDDLDVKPILSAVSSITMLNKFNVKEVGELEVKTVSVGIEEGLKLLKASLESKMVLTEVFLGKENDTSIHSIMHKSF